MKKHNHSEYELYKGICLLCGEEFYRHMKDMNDELDFLGCNKCLGK